MKLLNINAFAELLLKNYTGPKLDTFQDFQIVRSKEKQQLVTTVLDTLKNLMAEWCLESNIDTKMGFLLGKIINLHKTKYIEVIIYVTDAECFLDQKCNPIAIKKVTDHPDKPIK